VKWRWSGKTEFFLFLLATGLLLLPILLKLDGIPFHPNAKYTDLLTSHWPNANFLRTELFIRGEFPLWNPLILSGAPLVADPLFSIWYPPYWLTIILPLTQAFNTLFILHLAWAGFGMFVFLRAEGKSRAAAIFAGLAFGGTPKLLGHIGLGHVGLISAVAWTPWVLLCVRRTLTMIFEKQGGEIRWAALSGGVVAITFFADPRWLIPVAGLTLTYGAFLIIKNGWFRVTGQAPFLYSVLIFGITALGISSGLSLPLSEFLDMSTRANISPETAAVISLPLNNMLKFLIPDLGGWPETLPYVGTIILGLALIGLISRSRGWKFWLIVTIGSLLLAMGDHTPLYALIAKITPGMKFIRVPARFLFLSSFGLAVLSGMGFESIFAEENKHLPVSRLTSLGYGASVILLGIAITIMGGSTKPAGLYMIVSACVFLTLFFLSTSELGIVQTKEIFWIVAIIFELMIFRGSILEIQSVEAAFDENLSVLQSISDEGEVQRVFSNSYSLPQHIAGKNLVQLADGINPLQLESYANYMVHAVGYPEGDYSVTIPPYPDGDPSTPQSFSLNAEELGYLNIAYVLSDYPLDAAALDHIDTVEGIYIYENAQVKPRAWIEASAGEGPRWREVNSIEWSPNEVVVRASGPGMLILSEMVYPGWVVTVDDQHSPILEYQEIFRAVSLEPGEHLIRFTYRPQRVYIGAAISVLTMITLAWVWIKR
jgi:hypothetical protein